MILKFRETHIGNLEKAQRSQLPPNTAQELAVVSPPPPPPPTHTHTQALLSFLYYRVYAKKIIPILTLRCIMRSPRTRIFLH